MRPKVFQDHRLAAAKNSAEISLRPRTHLHESEYTTRTRISLAVADFAESKLGGSEQRKRPLIIATTPGGRGVIGKVNAKSSLSPVQKSDVQKRLKSIRGQVDGVMRMVDDDRYCIDVMRQISAIVAALERVSKIELKNHFEHCYADAIRSGDEARAHAEIAELLGLTELN